MTRKKERKERKKETHNNAEGLSRLSEGLMCPK